MLPGYRQVILDKLARCAGMPDIEERIVFERHLTPADIHERYRVLNGAIYGLASHGRFFGAFKPGNRSRDLAGLYLAGGAAHPGPGMPMVLMSGWIAADSLDQDRGTNAPRLSARSTVVTEPALARRSPVLFRLFGLYLRWYFYRSFHACGSRRRAAAWRCRAAGDRLFQPSLLVGPGGLHPDRHRSCSRSAQGYGPIDEKALGQYGLLSRMGAFGVPQDEPGGAAIFLRTSLAVLARPAAMLMVTAEGRFTDPRSRPIVLRPGLAHVARRVPDAVILPLALEYSFWNESRAEVLMRFGPPVYSARPRASVAAWNARLQASLADTMDALAQQSATRNAGLFQPLLRGAAGVGGIYDVVAPGAGAAGRAAVRPSRTRASRDPGLGRAGAHGAAVRAGGVEPLRLFRAPALAQTPPPLSVLIPARNEEANIAAAAAAVLASEGVVLELVVLDDGSTDATAADPGRHRRPAPARRHRGHAAAGLVGQAACLHDPAGLAAARADGVRGRGCAAGARRAGADGRGFMQRTRIGLASGFPRQVVVGWSEQLLLPLIHFLLLGFLPMVQMRRVAGGRAGGRLRPAVHRPARRLRPGGAGMPRSAPRCMTG